MSPVRTYGGNRGPGGHRAALTPEGPMRLHYMDKVAKRPFAELTGAIRSEVCFSYPPYS